MIKEVIRGVIGSFVFVLIIWGVSKTLFGASRVLGPLPQYVENLMVGMTIGLTCLGILAIIVMSYRKSTANLPGA